MARVIDVFKEANGHVRTAKLLIVENKLRDNSKTMVHPTQMLILLDKNKDVNAFVVKEFDHLYGSHMLWSEY